MRVRSFASTTGGFDVVAWLTASTGRRRRHARSPRHGADRRAESGSAPGRPAHATELGARSTREPGDIRDSAARTGSPAAGRRGPGTTPGIVARRVVAGAALGHRRQQRRGIRMLAARRRAHRRGAPRRPAPAYMTTTRRAISATTPMLCVTSISAMPRSLLQPAQQVEDLRLDRHVERGRRLVGDQQPRIAGDGHRDHHALVHAAGELMRIVSEPARCGRDPDLLEQFGRAIACGLARRSPRCSRSVSHKLEADR